MCKSACNYTGKKVQLFHESLRKGVIQLLSDPNDEANQLIKVSYC